MQRCDKQWFLDTFCQGKALDKDVEIWEHVTHFNLYSPLALLSILPEDLVDQCLEVTHVSVRAATHRVIGWSYEEDAVVDPIALREILLHSLIYGARCNVSAYDLESIPSVRIQTGNRSQSRCFDMSEDALAHRLADFQQRTMCMTTSMDTNCEEF